MEERFEGHGYAIRDKLSKEKNSLMIGVLPGRKRICLYHQTRNNITPLALFESQEKAETALRLLDGIAEGSFER